MLVGSSYAHRNQRQLCVQTHQSKISDNWLIEVVKSKSMKSFVEGIWINVQGCLLESAGLKLVHVLLHKILFVGWDDITIIWDENIVSFFNWEKKTVLDQKEVCLLNFHQQTMVISSPNNVQKYCTKRQEQV